LVKKTALRDFDSNRSGGVIAINLRDGDAVIAARLVSPDDDLLLVSRKGQSIRFRADDDALRPMGRATSGVIGMRFKHGDELLAMMVARPDAFVFTATDGGYAKRTPIDEYPVQGRGGQGVLTAKLTDDRGGLVGALMVDAGDEVFAITSSGGVIRTRADEVRPTSRATMGVRLINLGDGDAVVGVTRNAESAAGVDDIDDAAVEGLIDADLSGGAAGRTAEPAANGDNEIADTRQRDGGSVTGTQGDSPADQATDSAADPEQGDS
jgi:DNA gyrase subunit A